MIDLFNVLAQATTTSAPATRASDPYAFWRSIFPLILIIGVFWWIMSRGRSKERKRYQQMLDSLKRNDRVQTIGGIIGTVVDVREDEVVLKVDEGSNTKMRFSRAAIKGVVSDASTVDEKS